MSEQKTVGVGFDIAEYWQVKALAVEWLYVLDKLKNSVRAPPHEQHCVMGTAWDSNPLYLLKKKYYPAEEMARVTGLTVDKLNAYKGIITLDAKITKLPEPNVPYWGLA